MPFLPDEYTNEVAKGRYMRLEEGPNKLRILSDATVGYEYWVTDSDGNRSPIRVRTVSEVPQEYRGKDDRGFPILKHFWAVVVYNYKEKCVQILEITQAKIRGGIQALYSSEDWGDPKDYDITITRTGQKLETDYVVQPSPKRAIDKGVLEEYADLAIDLNALFLGESPFGLREEISPEEVTV